VIDESSPYKSRLSHKKNLDKLFSVTKKIIFPLTYLIAHETWLENNPWNFPLKAFLNYKNMFFTSGQNFYPSNPIPYRILVPILQGKNISSDLFISQNVTLFLI
jgi:hypothetical protein